jgi:dihydrofolate reductase
VERRICIDDLLLYFSECLQDVQRQREKCQREESARIFLLNEDSSTPMNLTNTLKKLNIEKQSMIYYIGGIDLLCQLIKNGLIENEIF